MSPRPWHLVLAAVTATTAVAAVAVTLHATVSHSPRQANAGVPQRITIYSGRAESLVGELIDRFQRETGIEVRVKYGRSGPLAAMILEEGRRSPADVFFAQDPGGLGVLADAACLAELPPELLDHVDYEHRDPQGRWVGVTGRLRTICYSTERVRDGDLPQSVLEFTQPHWRGRVGWAPSNASFQAFITAMRHQHGEEATERWLRDMIANGARTYPGNMPIVHAIVASEIDVGLVNHYYLHRFVAERGNNFPAANYLPAGADGNGDVCGAMLVSGAAMLETSRNREAALRFIEFLLSETAQEYFANETFEYPLASGDKTPQSVPPIGSLRTRALNLNTLGDLEATVAMLRRTGALR